MNSDLPFTSLVALGAGIGPEAPPAKQSFDEWLRTAKSGEVYVYAVRHVLDNKTPPETQAEALLAREAFARGEIEPQVFF
jgi:hypothetical protein